MIEKPFRILSFLALLLIAPVQVFLVQAIFVVPPVFLLASRF